MTSGILAAIIAFLCWGFGDFFIQRSARRTGTLPALFAIVAAGSIILLPFVWRDLHAILFDRQAMLLGGIAVGTTMIAALLQFEAFRKGKMSVVEPVLSFELVLTAAIGIAILGERVRFLQAVLMVLVFIGILLTVIHRQRKHWWQFWRKRRWIEQGTILAVAGMVAMVFVNIYTGLTSRATNPVAAIWVIHTGLALLLFAWMLGRRELGETISRIREAWRPVALETIFDNAAWIAYAAAVITVPISLTIAITESYIALATLLGILVNRERLVRHQYAGIIIAISSAILLAIFSG